MYALFLLIFIFQFVGYEIHSQQSHLSSSMLKKTEHYTSLKWYDNIFDDFDNFDYFKMTFFFISMTLTKASQIYFSAYMPDSKGRK